MSSSKFKNQIQVKKMKLLFALAIVVELLPSIYIDENDFKMVVYNLKKKLFFSFNYVVHH